MRSTILSRRSGVHPCALGGDSAGRLRWSGAAATAAGARGGGSLPLAFYLACPGATRRRAFAADTARLAVGTDQDDACGAAEGGLPSRRPMPRPELANDIAGFLPGAGAVVVPAGDPDAEALTTAVTAPSSAHDARHCRFSGFRCCCAFRSSF